MCGFFFRRGGGDNYKGQDLRVLGALKLEDLVESNFVESNLVLGRCNVLLPLAFDKVGNEPLGAIPSEVVLL